MPQRALRICAAPGCSALVPSGHCASHRRIRRKDPEQVRFYGSSRWKTLRRLVRQQEPVCALCGKRPTASVDHVDGNWRNNSRDNLRGLCTSCEKCWTGRQHQAKAGGVIGNFSRADRPPVRPADFPAYGLEG